MVVVQQADNRAGRGQDALRKPSPKERGAKRAGTARRRVRRGNKKGKGRGKRGLRAIPHKCSDRLDMVLQEGGSAPLSSHACKSLQRTGSSVAHRQPQEKSLFAHGTLQGLKAFPHAPCLREWSTQHRVEAHGPAHDFNRKRIAHFTPRIAYGEDLLVRGCAWAVHIDEGCHGGELSGQSSAE